MIALDFPFRCYFGDNGVAYFKIDTFPSKRIIGGCTLGNLACALNITEYELFQLPRGSFGGDEGIQLI